MEELTYDIQKKIEILITETMKKTNVPGVSLVIVIQDDVYYISRGYKDNKKELVTPSTCFELGSLSKAYTGLAILILEQRKIISLDDPVCKFIPWIEIYNRNSDSNMSNQIMIKDLLYHTSGIPSNSIKLIPSGNGNNMLKKTVSKLNGIICNSNPGEIFEYSTINYDILGYIIEIVTGEDYEVFIKKNILDGLELNSTFLSRKDVLAPDDLSTGYKMAFGHVFKYKAPEYRGNLPAGYIISNAIDMGKWISAHLGSIELNKELAASIQMSHVGDKTVKANGRYYYGCGWYVHIHGKLIKHGGSNPNYSNMLLIDKQKRIGICVLTNMNSIAAQSIAENTMRLICERKIKPINKDYYMKLDRIFSYIAIFQTIVLILLFYLIRNYNLGLVYISNTIIKSFFFTIVILIFLYFFNRIMLKLFFKNMSWKMIYIWTPYSVTLGYGESLFLLFIVCGIIINLLF